MNIWNNPPLLRKYHFHYINDDHGAQSRVCFLCVTSARNFNNIHLSFFQWIPETGIDIFAYLVHGHKLTREIEVQHYRDGKELKPIATENNYDFNSQVIHHYKHPRKIKQVSNR